MSKHTPAPWAYQEGEAAKKEMSTVFKKGDPEFLIAWVLCEWSNRHQRKQDVANARLIAAAPDLLAACRDVLEFLDNGSPVHPGCLLEQEISAAVARAEGSETGPGPGKDAP